MSISLLIPAYNEEQRIGTFLESIAAWLAGGNGVGEIIVVDDGSTDTTTAVVERYKKIIPSLSLIRHERNRGKGAAVQTGVMAAIGDLIIFMDADGATPISELPKMTAALNEADVVVGNRWLPGARTTRHSRLRQLSGWLYRRYMALFGLGDVDTMCGFKGYRRAVARDLFKNILEKRWLFDTEIAYKARRRGYRVKNIPITWTSQDGSKLGAVTLVTSALKIWPLIRRIRRNELRNKWLSG